eukprot:TRINITY_DN1966_c0_g2_i1.p1 TRINITY_DN1966_c0_g2~~TRINITY_DN1966_c0_g2_i1.p1  ORF type:complete len:174 (-),score=56.10 TRINITY_DN1966_c0_g2_i1:40-561(-)
MGVQKRKNAKAKKENGGYTVKKKKIVKSQGNLLTGGVKQRWVASRSLRQNFESVGLAYDVNASVDKYLPVINPDLDPEEFEVEGDTKPVVDILEVPAEIKEKVPMILGPREQWYCKRLYDKHGLNYEAMVRDRKNNYFQCGEGMLKRKITAYLERYKDALEAKEAEKAAEEKK